jgi:uncharacterized membrane protein
MKVYILIFCAIGVLGVFGGEFIFTILVSKSFTLKEKLNKLKVLLMFPIYGMAGMLISLFYLIPFFRDVKSLPLLMLIGMIVANLFELGSGMLLNKVLKLNIWDYSDQHVMLGKKKIPLHILGQIDVAHSVIWLGLTVVIVYLSEIIKWLAG